MKKDWTYVLIFWNLLLTFAFLFLLLSIWDLQIESRIAHRRYDANAELILDVAEAVGTNAETLMIVSDVISDLQKLTFDNSNRITTVWGEVIDIRVNGP